MRIEFKHRAWSASPANSGHQAVWQTEEVFLDFDPVCPGWPPDECERIMEPREVDSDGRQTDELALSTAEADSSRVAS